LILTIDMLDRLY